ncbi:MAG: YceD family protein [Coriobacteriia bacterium]|nr:YceD family protein [Coriobacteriia bacterium]
MTEQVDLPFRLLPELEETGSQRELEGVLMLEQIRRGYQVFQLRAGISYQLELRNTGDGVLLRGLAQGEGVSECARCLEEAAFAVEGEVEGYYILKPDEQELGLSDDEFTAVGADGVVDLAVPITAAIIYELPQVLLCSEDCAGLCPRCGVNLNTESCDCAQKPNPDSPFAKLKDLVDSD